MPRLAHVMRFGASAQSPISPTKDNSAAHSRKDTGVGRGKRWDLTVCRKFLFGAPRVQGEQPRNKSLAFSHRRDPQSVPRQSDSAMGTARQTREQTPRARQGAHAVKDLPTSTPSLATSIARVVLDCGGSRSANNLPPQRVKLDHAAVERVSTSTVNPMQDTPVLPVSPVKKRRGPPKERFSFPRSNPEARGQTPRTAPPPWRNNGSVSRHQM